MQFGIFSVSDITRDPVTGYTPSEAERIDEPLHHLSEVVKGVDELRGRRSGAVAESWIVRCDQTIAVGQQRDEIAEHMRGGRKSMQQEDRRQVRAAGLPVEDFNVLDRCGPVMNLPVC